MLILARGNHIDPTYPRKSFHFALQTNVPRAGEPFAHFNHPESDGALRRRKNFPESRSADAYSKPDSAAALPKVAVRLQVLALRSDDRRASALSLDDFVQSHEKGTTSALHRELVQSVLLTPKEPVNITHRKWTVTTSKFETLVSGSLEGYSETGVTEKRDLNQATQTQAKQSSALDVNGARSASGNGVAYSVTATAAVDYKQKTDVPESTKNSVAHSNIS